MLSLWRCDPPTEPAQSPPRARPEPATEPATEPTMKTEGFVENQQNKENIGLEGEILSFAVFVQNPMFS